MNRESFLATAWNNGQWSTTGAGYGLKVSIEDRDRFFDREWESVTLRLGVDEIRCVAETKCRESLILGRNMPGDDQKENGSLVH